MPQQVLDARISPHGNLDLLSRLEVGKLLDTSQGVLYPLFRNSSLAVLNYGDYLDDGRELLERYKDFDIRVIQEERGLKLHLRNAPASAFVDGTIIRGINEHLFAVLRDIVYVDDTINNNPRFDLTTSDGITNAVFHILRNAGIMQPRTEPHLAVCWGGHSITPHEYDYSKEVGYELGLRGFDICTGCGPGAMKGPMKGATIGHAKQRIYTGQYLGITEPGIIASESPNPIVNDLVIMPDIEKRLEAFVRIGHAIIVFPGGVGTAEEILYILSILLDPSNSRIPLPLIFTGPDSAADYFEMIDHFIIETLGPAARQMYSIIINDPEAVARQVVKGIDQVRRFRLKTGDAYYFNWLLNIDLSLQLPFVPTHENMHSLNLHRDQPPHLLASNLRRAFSGIVSGNVKEAGIRLIEEKGAFELCGDTTVMNPLDTLLTTFVEQQRMKLPTTTYQPCYRLTTHSDSD
ncbi:nucleotide 5'-monophosphate nucleosidase PpnN [Desulfobulbus oligotrophicus]|jgi:predicted Rossmann-fold nucleotide-binding protein|uniref:AMP nucleosidase n=1 Tax=Desulfobulbus oligotrophicus TaxID=1909699 RepID=A0A7T5VDZ8_9BACT|nr:nucleotide 5'-monophosphate nucleosidase PpnN [Desulfobulbus oligotrophicus]MDY0391479.1 nucleotide 5'-monophosphate nucleosidase PpnN [Desulfobulbus oligotrophicus]QQG66180.1 LOG family protein [Desulfobulbus oligotrophicus]